MLRKKSETGEKVVQGENGYAARRENEKETVRSKIIGSTARSRRIGAAEQKTWL